MTDQKHKPTQAHSGKNSGNSDDKRHNRLKLKLRENLKRRKSQERQRSRAAEVSSDSHQTSPDGEVGKTDA